MLMVASGISALFPMGVLASLGVQIYRLVLMVLFTYIFIPGHLTPNKGNLSRVECSSIVLSHVQCFHSWQ